jgi:hypothetical protein
MEIRNRETELEKVMRFNTIQTILNSSQKQSVLKQKQEFDNVLYRPNDSMLQST